MRDRLVSVTVDLDGKVYEANLKLPQAPLSEESIRRVRMMMQRATERAVELASEERA